MLAQPLAKACLGTGHRAILRRRAIVPHAIGPVRATYSRPIQRNDGDQPTTGITCRRAGRTRCWRQSVATARQSAVLLLLLSIDGMVTEVCRAGTATVNTRLGRKEGPCGPPSKLRLGR